MHAADAHVLRSVFLEFVVIEHISCVSIVRTIKILSKLGLTMNFCLMGILEHERIIVVLNTINNSDFMKLVSLRQ